MSHELYEKNLAALRVRFPALAKAAETWTADGVTVVAAAVRAPSASPAAVPAVSAVSAIIAGRHVHSPRDPQREAERLVAASLGAGRSGQEAVVLLGFGLGWTAEAAARLDALSPLLIVERRTALFRTALESRDLTAFFARKNLVFVISDDSHAVLAGLEAVKKTGVVIKNRALCELDGDFYDEVERLIETWAAKDRINQATQEKFGKLWERNNRRNLVSLRDLPGVRYFAGKLPFPALLVAAGPSLDELRPHIKALSERTLVVACDTALRFLADNGVTPHFAVSTDAQFWNYLHIAGLPPAFLKDVILIAESAVYPLALGASFKGRFLFASLYPTAKAVEARVDPKGALGAGGSVATSAWDFARFAGASGIWAAGLDLAFPGYRTHYKGAVFEERIHAASTRFKPCETQSVEALRGGGLFRATSADGGKTLTDKRLSLYAAWFENAVKNAPRTPAFQFSGQGLDIKGIRLCAPESLLALPVIKRDVDEALSALVAAVERDFYAEEATHTRAERFKAAICGVTVDPR
ncbi:MAG: DUF115 domain-containing protein [Spirochaetaceae bacterium]|jgi:hypothetical protein|nr:DUF115 domain-containing protein [Spirochaetaceae bacterium]